MRRRGAPASISRCSTGSSPTFRLTSARAASACRCSEDETQRLLKAEKVFQGVSGEFDPDRFKQIIHDAGFSERSFLVDQKGAYLRKEITDSVTSGLEPPRLMLEAISPLRNDNADTSTRFLLPASASAPSAAPSEEEVKNISPSANRAFAPRSSAS